MLNCVGLTDPSGTSAKKSGPIKLVSGKRTITCTLDMPADRTDFRKLIDINVDFNYQQKIDTQVLVKHIVSESTTTAIQ